MLREQREAFAFLDFLNREVATTAKEALDGAEYYGRALTVRRANHKSTLFVRDIPLSVSNEILYKAFEQFGQVDRAVVVTDAHGKHQRYGFVEFARKNAVQKAIKDCTNRMFCLAKNTPPVRVEAFVPTDHEDGYPESRMQRSYKQVEQVSQPPHFLTTGTKTHEEFKKWKDLMKQQEKEKTELKAKHTTERNKCLGGIMKALIEEEHKKEKDAKEKHQADLLELKQKEAEIAKAQAAADALRERLAPGQPLIPGDPPRGITIVNPDTGFVTTGPAPRRGGLLPGGPLVHRHHAPPPEVRPGGALLARPGPGVPIGARHPAAVPRPNPALFPRDAAPGRRPPASRGRDGSLLGPAPPVGRVRPVHAHPAPGAAPPGPKRRRYSGYQ